MAFLGRFEVERLRLVNELLRMRFSPGRPLHRRIRTILADETLVQRSPALRNRLREFSARKSSRCAMFLILPTDKIKTRTKNRVMARVQTAVCQLELQIEDFRCSKVASKKTFATRRDDLQPGSF